MNQTVFTLLSHNPREPKGYITLGWPGDSSFAYCKGCGFSFDLNNPLSVAQHSFH